MLAQLNDELQTAIKPYRRLIHPHYIVHCRSSNAYWICPEMFRHDSAIYYAGQTVSAVRKVIPLFIGSQLKNPCRRYVDRRSFVAARACISIETRQQIIDDYLTEGANAYKLARRYEVSPRYVYNLIHEFRETGVVNTRQRRKLDDTQLMVAQTIIEQNPQLSLGDLRTRLHEATGVLVSHTFIYRMRKNFRNAIDEEDDING